MFKSTELFIKKLEEDNIKYEFYHNEEDKDGVYEEVDMIFSTDNITRVRVNVIFPEDEFFIKISCFEFCKINENKLPATLELINKLNKEYNLAKFWISDTCNIFAVIDTDATSEDTDFADLVSDYVTLLLNIVDEVYPELMKKIWQ